MKNILAAVLTIIPIVLNSCAENQSGTTEIGPPWIVYTRASTKGGLVDDYIKSILVDPGNKKWFATKYGASQLSNAGWGAYTTDLQYLTYSQGGQTTSRDVNTMVAASDGSIWFGLAGGGVKRYVISGPVQTWTTFRFELASPVVQGMSTDRFGNIWCATTYGVSQYKPSQTDPTAGEWINYYSDNSGLPSNFVRTVKTNFSQNTVWFGSEFGDLIFFDGGVDWNNFTLPVPGSPIWCLAIEGGEYVWIGTNDGIFRFSPGSGWVEYSVATTSGAIPSNIINTIAVDLSGAKWFGTNKGLVRFKNNAWTVFNRSNSPLPSDIITALAIDIRGNLWIGTDSGVAEFNESGTR